MNTNSFQMKGLSVTLVTGLLAVYAAKPDEKFILIGIVPTTLFWFLDAYYLWQERKFRGLFKDLTINQIESELVVYDMSIATYTGGDFRYCKVLFSPTIYPMYLLIIGVLGLVGGLLMIYY